MGSAALALTPDTMAFTGIIVVLLIIAVSADDVVRKPRLFYVSTSSTTTTISTASICYVTSADPTAQCTGRRKRMIMVDGETQAMVQPSRSVDSSSPVEGSVGDSSPGSGREGRFLLYWITTTSVSTTTSYTTTYSISSVLR